MIGTVQAIAKGGCGIVRDAGKTIFIPGVIGGETVEFALQGMQKGIWQGDLQRIVEPSSQRVAAPCRHYGDCGGCNLQHMSYAEQLRCKRDILAVNLRKIAGHDPGQDVPVTPSPPWRYRSKIELQVKDSAVGFFRHGSHRLVAVSQCLLLSDACERFVLGLPPFPAGTDGVLQVLDNGTDLAARLQTRAGKTTWLTPVHSLSFDLAPFTYRCGPEHFIQANLFQLRPMQELLAAHVAINPGAAAADLFCGCGFFTLPLAQRCERVLALENDPGNLAALRANLRSNRMAGVEVCSANALKAELPPLDLAVLDPPRGGLSDALIAAVARARVKKVIYFSCDSATFARDLRLLFKQGYELGELRIIDNFPQTDHFEIFSVLEKTI
jgi:23S rRNA (uracil1939-C5)-methyltransferase